MDAGELLRILHEVLQDVDRSITAVLDGILDFEEHGRLDALPPDLAERLAVIRARTVAPQMRPAAQSTPRRFSRKPQPRNPKKGGDDVFRQDGVPQVELQRPPRGKRVHVAIPGREPTWISREQAALLEALAEPTGLSGDKLVAFKTVPQLARRIAQLSGSRVKLHTITSSICRLRKSLGDRGLVQTRDAHSGDGVITAYRFALLSDGSILKHPPDCGAIGPATEGDR